MVRQVSDIDRVELVQFVHDLIRHPRARAVGFRALTCAQERPVRRAIAAAVDALKREMLEDRVLHADETPVAMLKPGNGKTHRAYLWSYCTTAYSALRAVVFDIAEDRGGQHARAFLGLTGEHGWCGTLVCDDFSGYKACFELGVTEAGCLAHARRKFHALWANHGSPVGERALKFFGELYDIERDVAALATEERKRIRQERSRKVADALHQWLTAQRQKVPEGSATARAIDYSLKRWQTLKRYIDDGDLPADNNRVENQIRPSRSAGPIGCSPAACAPASEPPRS